MTESQFALFPFADSNAPEIKITGKISRRRNVVMVHYFITGDIASIHFPKKNMCPERKHDLWKATCFEFFIAIPNQPQYWEYNISPSGDWNIYHMDAYRRVGFREETLIKELQIDVRNVGGYITVVAATDLSPIISEGASVQVGITSVIKTDDGYESYWALSHPNPQADFHVRESFILTMAAE